MGFFSGIRKVAGAAMGAARAVNKIPVVGTALKAVPGVGTALTVAGAAASLSSGFGRGGGGSALPTLPGGFTGLPIPGMGAPGTMGQRGWLSNDPNVIEAIKPWAISKGNLRTYYRAPKGFVIVYDQVGDPYALPRKMAQMLRLWKAAPKPPISVGDFQALKRADRTAKKVKKILSMTTRVDKNVGKGGRVLIKKKKG
jgi:hypothetical protein